MLLSVLLTTLVSTSCGKGNSSAQNEFDLGFIEASYTIDDPLPNEALTFSTNVSPVNFSSEQEEKIQKALELIKQVVATEEFKNRILTHTYNGSYTFVDNKGYSNAQIYQIILNAAERLTPTRNNMMDMDVELYYANTNVVGYTYPSTTRIWVNTKYFNSYGPASVARNLVHEWLHKLGFEHAQNWSAARDHSVPYAIGNLVSEIGSRL